MMLHRHFEEQKKQNMTKLEDVSPKSEDFVSEVFPPEDTAEVPRRRGRPRKTEE